MIAKSDILLGQIKDKFSTLEKVDRSKILKGHAVEQFTFRCRISFYIYALQVSIFEEIFVNYTINIKQHGLQLSKKREKMFHNISAINIS